MPDVHDILEQIAQQVVVLKALLTEPLREPQPLNHDEEMSLAEQIVGWRKAHDWTQDALARALGTSQAVVARFEDETYGAYSLRSLRRLAEVFGAQLVVRLAPRGRGEGGWQAMDTAPKDGRAVLLLSAAQTVDTGLNGIDHQGPRVAIGHWNPDGDAWVDEMGRLDGEAYQLAVTGVWLSGHGWFQPNDVTHWRPLPDPPHRDA